MAGAVITYGIRFFLAKIKVFPAIFIITDERGETGFGMLAVAHPLPGNDIRTIKSINLLSISAFPAGFKQRVQRCFPAGNSVITADSVIITVKKTRVTVIPEQDQSICRNLEPPGNIGFQRLMTL